MIKIIQQKDFLEGTEGGRRIAVGHRELCNGYDKLNFLHYLLFFTVPGKFCRSSSPSLINVSHILYTICVIVFLNSKTTLSPAIEDDKLGASRYWYACIYLIHLLVGHFCEKSLCFLLCICTLKFCFIVVLCFPFLPYLRL